MTSQVLRYVVLGYDAPPPQQTNNTYLVVLNTCLIVLALT